MSAPVIPLSSPSLPAPDGRSRTRTPSPLAAQLPRGRLVELTGDRAAAHLSTAVACLRHAQTLGETAAWVQPAGGALFPPDLADCGVDLEALLVVHVPAVAGPFGLAKAAELLLRSGGFGMVVMDLGGMGGRMAGDSAWLGRLLGLAREHDAWLLLLSEPAASGARTGHASLGPLVSLRIHPTRSRLSPGSFTLTPEVLKDKSGQLHAVAPETGSR